MSYTRRVKLLNPTNINKNQKKEELMVVVIKTGSPTLRLILSITSDTLS